MTESYGCIFQVCKKIKADVNFFLLGVMFFKLGIGGSTFEVGSRDMYLPVEGPVLLRGGSWI